MRFKRRTLVLASLALVATLGSLGALHYLRQDKAPESQAGSEGKNGRGFDRNRPQPVTVAEVAVKDVPLWLAAIGSAVPRNLVALRSRVDGELLRLHFAEGQTVKKGQLLAEIDSRAFEAQLAQVKGQLARDSALLHNARVDLERYRELWSKDSIPRQQLDTQEALVRQHEGTVENDRGLVENARLQLAYTRIAAPVSGRIGLRQVDPGNQVRASDANGLASIAQMQPMTVVFAVPESHLPEINRRLGSTKAVPVEAWDREEKSRLASGRLLTTDNQIDPATGTIKLKAEFPNADSALFPNQFVNARLLLGIQKEATLVPAAAVQRGARGSFVYVLDGESAVKSVPVTPGATDGELVVVSGPLQAGQQVVVDGVDKLRDGARVEVITPEKRPPAGNGEARGGGRGKRRGEGEARPAAQ